MIAAKAAHAAKAKQQKYESGTGTGPPIPSKLSRVSDYNKNIDPRKFAKSHLIVRKYIDLAVKAHKLTTSENFNGFIIFVICIAGLLVGIQTYDFEPHEQEMLDSIDLAILGIFLMESILKIVAEGAAPQRYFIGPEWKWNDFDFVIVFMCLPFWEDTFGGNAAILRMMRLMRVMKIVKKVPQLHMIVMGLIGGLKSIAYILLLLSLVFYLYAIAGMYAFRANDPWHYGNLFLAIITLFRLATLEDWTDVMYINYFGCEFYGGGLYSQRLAEVNNSTYHCNTTEVYLGMDEAQISFYQGFRKGLSVFYFVTFVVISAFIMLSLFVGAITMSMTESMEMVKATKAENERRRRLEKVKKTTVRNLNKIGGLSSPKGSKVDLNTLWDGIDFTQMVSTTKKLKKESVLREKYRKLANYCFELVEHPNFGAFITYVILLAGVVVGVQTEREFAEKHSTILGLIDGAILAIFTFEVVLKFIGQGFTPLRYFRSGWNTFDLIIVVGSFLPGSGSLLTVLRLLRLLRVLKLVKSLPQLQVIVSALLKGVGSIAYIGIIMLLVFYIFAILGIILFKENDPWHFGTLHIAMLTLFRSATLEDWSDVMYINFYGCEIYGYSDIKDQVGIKPCKHTPQPLVSVAFFIIFVVIGALVLITLFIGVVTTSMEEATQEMNNENELKERIRQVQVQFNLQDEMVELFSMVFKKMDIDGNGELEMEEISLAVEMLRGEAPTRDSVVIMIKQMDQDDNNFVSLPEFIHFMCIHHLKLCPPILNPLHSVESGEEDSDEEKMSTNSSSKDAVTLLDLTAVNNVASDTHGENGKKPEESELLDGKEGEKSSDQEPEAFTIDELDASASPKLSSSKIVPSG